MQQVLRLEKSTSFEPFDDAPKNCGTGSIRMTLEKNIAVYTDFGTCMDFARSIANNYRLCSDEVVPFHLYWQGAVNVELLTAARSFLATQDLSQSVMWVWSTQAEPEDSRWTQLSEAAGDRLEWKSYDLESEIVGTPLEEEMDHIMVSDERRWVDSDLFRVLILYNYGGIYFDADVILLRDFAPIMGSEWLYQWGSSCNYANGAIASLGKHSDLAREFLVQISLIKPRINSFDWGRQVREGGL